jgi:hypothetical protein
VRTASVIIALMIEAVRTSETSAKFNVTTRRYIQEDYKLQIRSFFNILLLGIAVIWMIHFVKQRQFHSLAKIGLKRTKMLET